MILKIRIPQSLFPNPRRGFAALATAPAPAGATFHATLTDCMDDWVVEHSPRANSPRATPSIAESKQRRPRASGLGTLARLWQWLHTKYAQTATKRLRVSETVSLGEKRFVALVCVEGREFLIGGGSSGVSMLTPLGAAKEARGALRDELDDDAEEDSE